MPKPSEGGGCSGGVGRMEESEVDEGDEEEVAREEEGGVVDIHTCN